MKHQVVTPLTDLKIGDFVIIDDKFEEIYGFDDNHGMLTSAGWICRSKIPKWQPNPDIPKWIVCAACKHLETGLIICGARHFDYIMRSQIKANNLSFLNCEQGFIDQYGRFYNRKEAWKIAEENGQIRRPVVSTHGELYSEYLY